MLIMAPPWHPLRQDRRAIVDKLAAIGLPAVPQLIKALKAPRLFILAQSALVKIGGPAVPALIEALGHRNSLIAANAAEALGEIGDARAVAPLLPLLHARYHWTRREAAAALGKLGDPHAGAALLPMLDDPHQEVREAAAGALGHLKEPRAVEPLRRALDDPADEVQVAAAIALEQLDATEILLEALRRGSPAVRACVAADLVPEALSASQRSRAIEALLANLADSDHEVRDCAAQALRALDAQPSSTSP